jgi:hypothetical protein
MPITIAIQVLIGACHRPIAQNRPKVLHGFNSPRLQLLKSTVTHVAGKNSDQALWERAHVKSIHPSALVGCQRRVTCQILVERRVVGSNFASILDLFKFLNYFLFSELVIRNKRRSQINIAPVIPLLCLI